MSVEDAAKALTGAVKDYIATIKGGGVGRRPISHREWKKTVSVALGISKIYQKRMDEVVDFAIKKKMLKIVEHNDKSFFSIPVDVPFSDGPSLEEDSYEEVFEDDDGIQVWLKFSWEETGKWIPKSRVERLRKKAFHDRTKHLITSGAEEAYCSHCESVDDASELYLDSSGYYSCPACNDICPSLKGSIQDQKG